MNSVADFLKRCADKNGFNRERFEEIKIPTDASSICVMPFFCDLRSTIFLSSFLLNRYREEYKGSKYFISIGWSGLQGLFPYVDEYWSFADQTHAKRMYELSESMRNKSELSTMYIRNLNEFFSDVLDYREFQKYYENGFQNAFFEKFKTVKKFMPFVPSSTILGKDFNREISIKPGYKVFIHPSIFCKQWYMGKSRNVRPKKEFWIELVKELLENNFTPVIWHNNLSYDLSPEFAGRCIYVVENDYVRALSAMRATGCVLDVFNTLSRFAILARCPFLSIDERSRYTNQKEHESDDLLGKNLPKDYIFTFSTIITDGNPIFWRQDLLPSIVRKLNKFIPDLNRDAWPNTSEVSEIISYRDNVRKTAVKKFGVRFLKIPHE